jgi:hypothetical protein
MPMAVWSFSFAVPTMLCGTVGKLLQTMDGAKAMASNEVLLKLQQSMVKAVLLGQPLPGHDTPVRLADLEFVMRHQFVYLIDNNLASGFDLQVFQNRLRSSRWKLYDESSRVKMSPICNFTLMNRVSPWLT